MPRSLYQSCINGKLPHFHLTYVLWILTSQISTVQQINVFNNITWARKILILHKLQLISCLLTPRQILYPMIWDSKQSLLASSTRGWVHTHTLVILLSTKSSPTDWPHPNLPQAAVLPNIPHESSIQHSQEYW